MSTDNETSNDPAEDVTQVEPGPGDSPAEQAEKLEAKVEAARDDLGVLVGELDRRRHRATKLVPAGAIAVAIIAVGGYVLWRVLRSKPSRLQRFALERATAHPESVAKEQPNAAKKILVAAASAAAAVAARRAVTRWSSARAV